MATAHDISLPELARQNPSTHGLALIISNDYKGTDHIPLEGTVKDGNRMQIAFERLGIATIWRHNVTVRELKELLRGAAQLDPRVTKLESISFVFSGHGNKRSIALQDGSITLEWLTDSLSPKKARCIGDIPRLFFIDACRGKRAATSLTVHAVPRASCSKLQAEAQPSTLLVPKQANVLIAFSTLRSYSASDYSSGSKWINILADMLCKHVEHIETILTLVREKYHELQQHSMFEGKIQQPETQSTLLKEVILNKFKRERQSGTPARHAPGHSSMMPTSIPNCFFSEFEWEYTESLFSNFNIEEDV